MLRLSRNPLLTGSLPDSISMMTKLIEVDLSENSLSGSIPRAFVALERLRVLKLGFNDFTGSLMDYVVPFLRELRVLNVTNNPNLDDSFFAYSVPTTITASGINPQHLEVLDMSNCSLFGTMGISNFGNFGQLRVFRIDDNHFYGPLPALSASLELFTANRNQFSGTFPWSFSHSSHTEGRPANIKHIEVSGNRFTGDLPESIGELSQLEHLDLSYNQVQSSIPSSIGNLTKLKILMIQGNAVHGSLPSELGNLHSLALLDVSQNQLQGSLPTEMGDCANLEYLSVHSNALTGSVPTEFAQLSSLGKFSLTVL